MSTGIWLFVRMPYDLVDVFSYPVLPFSQLAHGISSRTYITLAIYLCSCHNRCENSGAIYLKEGYWAGIASDGTLVTFFCPYRYCNCKRAPGNLPGCLYDPDNIDGQCSKNRSGWLCGKCSGNTSVGLRYKLISRLFGRN